MMKGLKQSLNTGDEHIHPPFDKEAGISKEKAEEIVGDLYMRIGVMETEIMNLANAKGKTDRENALRQIRYISEKMTCYLRGVVSWAGVSKGKKEKEHFREGALTSDVSVKKVSYGYEIICPFRLPSKNTYRVNEYWWGMIEYVVREYAKAHEIDKLSKVLVAYLDLYPANCPACHVTDSDNQDIKKITDVIREVFLESDDSLHVWTLQLGAVFDGKDPMSKIFIVKQEKIAEWYALMRS